MELTELKGVGPVRQKQLLRLGLARAEDLVFHFPRAYEDRSVVKRLAEVRDGDRCSVLAHVATRPAAVRIREGMELLKFRIFDDSAFAEVTFFNQPWVKDRLEHGEAYLFYGSWEAFRGPKRVTNPSFERPDSPDAGAILPIYRTTAGLSQHVLGGLVGQAVKRLTPGLEDPLPEDLRAAYRLIPLRQAIGDIHRPGSSAAVGQARRRLVFEELLVLQLGLSRLGRHAPNETSVRIAPCDMTPFYEGLPFHLTDAQRRAVEEGLADLRRPLAMNRLVQGDVGSGKTAVAAALAYAAARSGYQTALMAPTEVLAEQHLRTLSGMLSPHGIRTALLTGGLRAAARREALLDISSGRAAVAVGTHALLEEQAAFAALGLVVTDEQHRFGVAQRSRLAAKGDRPHLLVMSATPIPRTLALMIYGDLDLSVIDQLPAGRRKVETYVADESMRPRIDRFIKKLLDEGRQAFVVCPLVEEGEDDRKAVQSYAKALGTLLAPHRVEALHGRMKPAEKEAAMRRFAAAETAALVSTTVVEVGVDVPNAALMVVENAEQFGLSQLHQLRGRVGRGVHQSYCILLSKERGERAMERLKTLCRTDDGFEIAQMDLQLRGPGDFFGRRQHGLPALHIADMGRDLEVLREVGEAAAQLLAEDPALESSALRALRGRAEALFERSEISLN